MTRRKSTSSGSGCGCLAWLVIAAFVGVSNGYGVTVAWLAGATVAIWISHELWFSETAIASRKQKQFQRYLSSLESSQIYDGHEFEHFIAQKLRDNGMDAQVTRGSGDQGVDVLATSRRGTRIAIQTKLYSRPVSNKAVQEVLAGMHFYNCATAVVITNNSFTESAVQLAAATGVKLIGCMQLAELESGAHWLYDS